MKIINYFLLASIFSITYCNAMDKRRSRTSQKTFYQIPQRSRTQCPRKRQKNHTPYQPQNSRTKDHAPLEPCISGLYVTMQSDEDTA